MGHMDDVIDGGDGVVMDIDGLISCLDGMDGSEIPLMVWMLLMMAEMCGILFGWT